MLERRAKQALQCALSSCFWGMLPPTSELESWQIMQPPQPQLGNAPPPAAATAPARERVDYPCVFSRSAKHWAPSCGLNALWFGVLSVIRTSSCSSSCSSSSSSNRASHSTAARCSDGLAQHNCATVQ